VSGEIVERVRVQAFQELRDALDAYRTATLSCEIHKVDEGEKDAEDHEEEQVLNVERRPDEAAAEALVLELKECYHS